MTALAHDNGIGGLLVNGVSAGTVDYAAGTLLLIPDHIIGWPVPTYSKVLVGSSCDDIAHNGDSSNTYRMVLSGYEIQETLVHLPPAGVVKVRYRVTGGDTTAVETVALTQLSLDLTKGYAETIVQGSTRFTLGGSTYVNTAGAIYRDASPLTGAGTLAGTLDSTTGRVLISSWIAGPNDGALQSMLTAVGYQPVDKVSFRTPVSPVKSGTMQIRWTDLTGTTFSKTIDGSGVLEDNDCLIRVDYARGVVQARFGRWRLVSELTLDDLAATWYSAGSIVQIGGVDSIWQSHPILAETVIYNAVAATFLPPDSELLGLDAARLPPDGQALIFTVGRLALVHHTTAMTPRTLSAGQTVDCGRVRLYRVVIADTNGLRLPADLYTVDRALGTLTMATPLDLAGFVSPYTISHTIADLGRIVTTDINGRIGLMAPISHGYPADTARLSGVLFVGTLQARISNLFAQSTWTSVWSDTIIGSAPLAKYNDAAWPLLVANAGAYQDRILVKFTTATAFQVIGENLGLIGVGDINNDCAPINPLTSEEYFTIRYQGWGGGWATGNCLRFNLHGALWPVDVVRAVQPSSPTGLVDSVELLLIGNIDA